MNKYQRLITINKIISESSISTQEELLNKLFKHGIKITQATLSRDLKELKVGKIVDNEKGSIYVINNYSINNYIKDDINFLMLGFLWIKFSNNLGVIKTKPGYASSIALLIDNSNRTEVLSTIAGDDTILVIPFEGISQKDLKKALILILPEIKEKF